MRCDQQSLTAMDDSVLAERLRVGRSLRFLIAACSALLASCAALEPAPLEDTMRSLEAAKTCCASPKEFKYEPLPPLESREFEISVESQAFEFSTGKSYFKAFALPAYTASYSIIIESFEGWHRPAGSVPYASSVFVPVAMFLDTSYAVTRVVNEVSFKRVDGSLLPRERLRLEATIPVGSENSQDRYIVIFTTRRALGGMTAGTVPQIIPIFLPGVVTALPTGRREPRYMHHAPVGLLQISTTRPKAP